MKNLMLRKKLQFFALLSSIAISTSAGADIFSPTQIPDLAEPEGTYESSAPTVINMKLKTVIQDGLCVTDEYEGCTLNDVLNDVNSLDDFKPEIKVHMTADDFPDDELEVNAEMRQRGATSRVAPQKSFRIKLDSSDALWRGERRIQLIKSFYDLTRVRNKLSYDLMADIPNLLSMRTQFVNLEVENEGATENYGLYTQVEYFGKEYLLRRGWDDDSGVYKAEKFSFRYDPAFELDADGKPVDEDAFEKLLEIKRGKDHTKLIEMINAVNNPALDFKTDVFEKYFNQDNYLSWLASNILLGNTDTDVHNYYLFNPKDSEKFYLVPWDYDLIGRSVESRRANNSRPRQSHANWWHVNLHKRFLQQPGNLALLEEAVLELKTKYYSKTKIQAKLDSYYNVIFPNVSTSPDIDFTILDGNSDPERMETYNQLYSDLANLVEESYELFLERIGDPMAFWLYSPSLNSDGMLKISWGASESLTGAEINYEIEVANSGSFETGSILLRAEQLSEPEYTFEWDYPAGKYFYRVIARDEAAPEQYLQFGSNSIRLDDGTKVNGVKEFHTDSLLLAIDDDVETTKNTPISIDILGNDLGSNLVLTAPNVWSLKGGNVALEDNQLIYTPKEDFVGEDNIWYNISNSDGNSSGGKVTIDVTSVSLRPDGFPDFADAVIGETITIDVLANDQGNELTLREPNAWSLRGGNVALVNNRLTYTPDGEFLGEDKIWYTFYDAQGRSDFGEVTINVTGTVGVYVRPDGTPDFAEATTGQTITIDVLANDMGNNLILREPNVWSLEGGNVEVVDNQIVYTSNAEFTGEDKIWYSFNDPEGRSDFGEVTITVVEEATTIE